MTKFRIPELGVESEWFNDEPTEIKTEVKTYFIEMECPKCKKGKMLHTGHGFPSSAKSPAGHHHECDKCQYVCTVRGKIYPRTIHEKCT
jgi:hypothetical protein